MKNALIALAIAWGLFGILLAFIAGESLMRKREQHFARFVANGELAVKDERMVMLSPAIEQFVIGGTPKRLSQDELDRRANNEVLAMRNHEIPHTLRKYNPDGTVEEWNPVDGCWRFIRNWNPETGSAFRR